MTLNPSLMKKAGFVSAQDRAAVKPRIIMSVSGLEKQGKTHFSLTAPSPIAYFGTDIGEEGVVGKFINSKEVWIKDVARLGEDAAGKAKEEYSDFKMAYDQMMRNSSIRTIIVDTATEIWELLRLARFGKLTQVMPYQYGPVNAEYRALIRSAYDFDKNLILLHKMKAQYIADKRTGEWERAGFSDTGFLVQVNAHIYRYDPSQGGEFVLYITDCRQNPDLAGYEFEGDMCNFQTVSSMIIPDADPSIWE